MVANDDRKKRGLARIGTVLRDKWRLDRLLGAGGFAFVYAATHRAGKRVAVKVLHAELSAFDELRARFIREAYFANTVDHPGVVSVLDDDVADDGAAFLVMDLLDGEDLKQRLTREGRLEPAEVLVIAHGVLDVLAAAHGKGLVHRDIKPENIFVTRAGEIKVLDFGVARALELASSGESMTQIGMVIGTPAFMPPEQARGRGLVDERSDLFAVGATMFALLTGRPPHGELKVVQAVTAALTRAVPSLASAAPQATPAIVDVVDRAMAFEKAERWSTARVMQEAVRAAYEMLMGQAISTAPRLSVPAGSGEAVAEVGPRAWGTPHGGLGPAGTVKLGGAEAGTATETMPIDTGMLVSVEPTQGMPAEQTGAKGATKGSARRWPMLLALGTLLGLAVTAGVSVALRGRGAGAPGEAVPVMVTTGEPTATATATATFAATATATATSAPAAEVVDAGGDSSAELAKVAAPVTRPASAPPRKAATAAPVEVVPTAAPTATISTPAVEAPFMNRRKPQ
jgi:serine/threonine-protein kinase